jgi:hypothetical protein
MFRFRRTTLGAAVASLIIVAGLIIADGLTTQAVAANAVAATLAGAQTSACVVNASPTMFIESGLAPQASSVAYIITVECQPTFSEQAVEIRTPQLGHACQGQLMWYSATTTTVLGNGDSFDVRLDEDGSATAVVLGGPNCAASWDLIEADLTVAPYTTATTRVQIALPVNTQPGVRAFPSSEVEDSTTASVATVFRVEFPGVDAGHEVQVSHAELYDSCAGHIAWTFPNTTTLEFGKSVTMTLDDNGNAFAVALAGPSCASGSTLVQADLVGPPYTTLTTQFTVLSPRVTFKGKPPKEAASTGRAARVLRQRAKQPHFLLRVAHAHPEAAYATRNQTGSLRARAASGGLLRLPGSSLDRIGASRKARDRQGRDIGGIRIPSLGREPPERAGGRAMRYSAAPSGYLATNTITPSGGDTGRDIAARARAAQTPARRRSRTGGLLCTRDPSERSDVLALTPVEATRGPADDLVPSWPSTT